jgi:phage tail-like protein
VTAAPAEGQAGPRVTGVQARAPARVRVSFDRPVKQRSASEVDDALNPALYLVSALSAPAAPVSVVGVASFVDSAVELLTDVPLTPTATYRLELGAVVDARGLAVAPPDNVALVSGFAPSRPANRAFDLYRLLPEVNRREDITGDLRRFLACLQDATDLLLDDIDGFTQILDPDVAPEPTIDLMLGELGNPFQFDLELVDKRRLLQVLVAMYREKGTDVGVRNAIRFFLGLEVAITSYAGEALFLGESRLGEDWVLGPSSAFAAYAFEIVAPRALEREERRRLREVVDYMKPAHTHFARLVEPSIPEVPDHLELGLSGLGESWRLHQ